MSKGIGYMQPDYQDRNVEDYTMTGGGGGYIDPTPVYYANDPIYTGGPDAFPNAPQELILDEQPVFQSVNEQPTEAAVYVDPGGDPINYTPINDYQAEDNLNSESYIPTQILPATDTTTTASETTDTTAPATGNKVMDWIKENPLAALAAGAAFYFLFLDKKHKVL